MWKRIMKKVRELKTRSRRQRTMRMLSIDQLEDRTIMDAGGNTIATATNLGPLVGTREVADYVGSSDSNDYYQFQVTQQSTVQLGLNGLQADADLRLLNTGGQTVASSTRSGTSAETISRVLDPGTYIVRVNRYSGNTNYRLTLNATPTQPTVTDNAGNSLSSARNLGTLTGERSLSDFVGNADRDDYYRFELTGRSTFDLGLSGLNADADVQLINASGGTVVSSSQGGSSSESIRRTLDAGVYYVRVFQFSGDTSYRLTLRATPDETPMGADGAGNTPALACNLGTLSGTMSINDWVGSTDSADYFRFRVNSASNFRLRLDGMTADADVQLLDANGNFMTGSANGGMNSEAVDRVLTAGDYFVKVYPFGNVNTNYRLGLDVAASPTFTLSTARETDLRAEFTGDSRRLELLNALIGAAEYRSADDAARLTALNKFRGAPNLARLSWIRGDLLRQQQGETPAALALLRPDSGTLTVRQNGIATTYTISDGNLMLHGNVVGTIENDGIYRLNGGMNVVSYSELGTGLKLVEGGNTVLEFQRAYPENFTTFVAPQMQTRITNLIVEARREGMNPRVAYGTGYRSPAQQRELYLQGGVTNADAWQSNHQYGLAVDVTLMSSDGSAIVGGEDQTRLGVIGEGFGLAWGGRWAGFPDGPHFEWPGLPNWTALKSTYAQAVGVLPDTLTATVTVPNGNGLQSVWNSVGAS